GLPNPPAVSMQTIAITGILVDIYGLEELPFASQDNPTPTKVSVLWLHNPRLGDRSRMAFMAKHVIGEYNKTRPEGANRGLIAAAFDQRNHGSRKVHDLANLAWKQGNAHHAQDMFGIISGTVVDTSLLIDALPGYLFLAARSDAPPPAIIDQHICLGVSLGGHSTWQALFADPRIVAGVSIIGCPDFQLLMADRARLTKLASYDPETKGAGFLGAAQFPPALVAQCARFDPKGIVFGTRDVPRLNTNSSEGVAADNDKEHQQQERERIRGVLDKHVRGKKLLMCTGGDDKLVPWRCSEPFTDWFVDAAQTWYADGGLSVDNRIYPGRGHECSTEMVQDAARFVCEVVNGAEA
ncbi:hypothetical protein BD289DRAFT_346395, partial [Coniella lustricola]